MHAVILAGGKGERLGGAAAGIPKPMAQISGKPLLERQIAVLKRHGITGITLVTGFLSEKIEQYFGDGSRFGVSISYYVEIGPLGTAGALGYLADKLQNGFLVIYGDIMFDMALDRLLAFHKSKKACCTLVVHPNLHPYDSDLIETDNDCRVVKVHAKPHKPGTYYRNLANTGLYAASPEILRFMPKGRKADFAKDILPALVEEARVCAYNTPEYLKDIGTPERLAEVADDFVSGRVAAQNLNNKRPAVFLDRDGVINADTGLLHKPEGFKLLDGAAQAVAALNRAGFLVIVATNQSVVARNLCGIKELELIHKKMETLLGAQGAKLDGIYYCPHHPDKGYPEENPDYKMVCNCRKPATGMIEAAARDFNVDLSASYMIGDADEDILCGRRAGLKTIGIKPGRIVKENPDFSAASLKEAIDLLLGQARR